MLFLVFLNKSISNFSSVLDLTLLCVPMQSIPHMLSRLKSILGKPGVVSRILESEMT